MRGEHDKLGEGERKVRLGQDSLPNSHFRNRNERKVVTLFYPHPHKKSSFVHNFRNPEVSGIPRRTEILELFPLEAVESFEEFGWAVESKTFPIFCKFLRWFIHFHQIPISYL